MIHLRRFAINNPTLKKQNKDLYYSMPYNLQLN